MFKIGQVFKSIDGTQEVEIVGEDLSNNKFRFIHRDSFGMMSQWDSPENIKMLISVLDLFSNEETNGNTKSSCWHNHKEKKWLLTTWYWKCKDCGKEFENE